MSEIVDDEYETKPGIDEMIRGIRIPWEESDEAKHRQHRRIADEKAIEEKREYRPEYAPLLYGVLARTSTALVDGSTWMIIFGFKEKFFYRRIEDVSARRIKGNTGLAHCFYEMD